MTIGCRTKYLVAAGLSLLVAGGVALLMYLHDYPVHHFAVVRGGILYRGGQPDSSALGTMRARYHIRTIVNLRGRDHKAGWYVEEERFCGAYGLKLVSIPMANPDQVRGSLGALLEVMSDPANHPVFVHCEAGSARVGAAVAAYRIAVQGWSLQDALAEAKRYRFKPEVNLNPQFVKVLQELADGADWRRLSDAGAGPAPKAVR